MVWIDDGALAKMYSSEVNITWLSTHLSRYTPSMSVVSTVENKLPRYK
jgi:hypothetical protein